MSDSIERIEREIGVPGLVSLLADRISPTDLQSILLEVYRQQARRKQPSAVLTEYEKNRFARPSELSPAYLLEWERIALSTLPPEFQAIALSPVSPLGTSSAVALVDQNKVLSTIRNTEVVSDSTNVLALECALRRRKLLAAAPKSATAVHLAASHRLLRTQRYDDPGSIPHFSAFALCSAGRDLGHAQFELSALEAHIGFYLRALHSYLGPTVPLRVALTDLTDGQSPLASQLHERLQEQIPAVAVEMDDQRASGRGYYIGLCFHVYALSDNQPLELADGGVVDWTQKLLNNAKERCIISGIGSERLVAEFRARQGK